MVKDQDSVSDTTAVQVGEEDTTEELEMENMKIFLSMEFYLFRISMAFQ